MRPRPEAPVESSPSPALYTPPPRACASWRACSQAASARLLPPLLLLRLLLLLLLLLLRLVAPPRPQPLLQVSVPHWRPRRRPPR